MGQTIGYRRPAPRPCETCPYRRDVLSGIWHPDEYAKLPGYDEPTWAQPTAVFLCHQADGRLCAGWAGCHDTDHLLALRFAAEVMDSSELEATCGYESPVPLWGSGAEAAAHGLAEVGTPSPDAIAAGLKITRRRP